MSLVSTWVLAEDGNFYQNPVLRGVRPNGKRWFLCFDDNEPPEFVLEIFPYENNHQARAAAERVLDSLSMEYKFCSPNVYSGRRSFTKGLFTSSLAKAFFISIKKPIPVPHEYDDSGSREKASGRNAVIYDFGLRKAASA